MATKSGNIASAMVLQTDGSSAMQIVNGPSGGLANPQPVGVAAINTGQGAVPTAPATVLVPARTGAPGTGRVAVTITNTGSAAIYVGNIGVTTTTGLPIPVNGSVTLNTTAAIYSVAAAAQTAAYVETF